VVKGARRPPGNVRHPAGLGLGGRAPVPTIAACTLAACALAACSGINGSGTGAPGAGGTRTGSAGTGTGTGPSPLPASPAPPAARPPTAAQPVPARVPLVLAVHPTRPPLNLTPAAASAVISGRVADWRRIGGPAGPLRLAAGPGVPGVPPTARRRTDRAALAAVGQDPGMVAAVPANAVGPGVRAARVAGRDPVRQPTAYPLTMAGSPPGEITTMTIVGDIMLARHVGEQIRAAADYTLPFRATARRLAAADLTVGTLESSLDRSGAPRQGDDSFGADPRVLAGVRRAGFDVLSLANNHVGDYGPPALVRTVRRVRAAGIAPVGAGADAAEARRPAVVERNGVRFGFLAFNAIGETPVARSASPGAVTLRMRPRLGPLNDSDLRAMVAAVRALRPRVGVLVVLPHWGQQYTARPVPDQRTVARVLVGAGADLVVGSHPHWVQGAEVYRGKLVAYSLGNFVFDMDFSRQTQEGAALELVFWDRQVKAAEFAPVRIGSRYVPAFQSHARGLPVLRRMWGASGPPFNAASS
jgi:poly-gamma-glutamate capsule biosynthesis protein CapA/YwtB (metallophosphatase superfamily)